MFNVSAQMYTNDIIIYINNNITGIIIENIIESRKLLIKTYSTKCPAGSTLSLIFNGRNTSFFSPIN